MHRWKRALAFAGVFGVGYSWLAWAGQVPNPVNADTSFVAGHFVLGNGPQRATDSGWSVVPLANGGCGVALTPAANNLVYTNASNCALLPTANNSILTTNAGGAIGWSASLPSGFSVPAGDLPLPTTTALGALESQSCASGQYISVIPATQVQPTCSTVSAAQLTNGVTGSGAVTLATSPTLAGTVTFPDASTWTASGAQPKILAFATAGLSHAAWTNNGLRFTALAETLTDTSSSGTVASLYDSNFQGDTIAASSATTYTNAYTLNIGLPAAGTNVTFTNAHCCRFNAIDMIGTNIDSVHNLTANTTGSYRLFDQAASGTAPTLLPNAQDAKAGIGASASGAVDLVVDVSSAATDILRADTSGHVTLNGSAPGIATAGGSTSPAIAGNDHVGRVTIGSSPSTATLTLTFAKSFANAPVCAAQDESTTAKDPVYVTSVSTTAVTFTAAATFAASDAVSYRCLAFR